MTKSRLRGVFDTYHRSGQIPGTQYLTTVLDGIFIPSKGLCSSENEALSTCYCTAKVRDGVNTPSRYF